MNYKLQSPKLKFGISVGETSTNRLVVTQCQDPDDELQSPKHRSRIEYVQCHYHRHNATSVTQHTEHQHAKMRTGTAGASVKMSREEEKKTTTHIRSTHAEKSGRRPRKGRD
jgi:hypothetical protein